MTKMVIGKTKIYCYNSLLFYFILLLILNREIASYNYKKTHYLTKNILSLLISIPFSLQLLIKNLITSFFIWQINPITYFLLISNICYNLYCYNVSYDPYVGDTIVILWKSTFRYPVLNLKFKMH